jgi:peptidoglycan/xylan/chitin deacetylase (PgdA/CDA1 family)
MPMERRNAILHRTLPTDGNSDGPEDVDVMLTWDQAREMSDAGVEIGAHTVSHPLLSHEDAASVERELKLSKQTLEERLGKKVRALAYPNGDWNERVRKQVEDTGYRCAFTTRPAWHDRDENLYTISRVLLHEGNITAQNGEFSPAMLNLTLAGWA